MIAIIDAREGDGRTPVQAQLAPAPDTPPLLEVSGLQTVFFTRQGVVKAVDGVSFSVKPRRRGHGVNQLRKSVTALSRCGWCRTLPSNRQWPVKLAGVDLWNSTKKRARRPRQNISMISRADDLAQSVMTSEADAETLCCMNGEPSAARKAVDMLRLVRIPEPEQRAKEYPHQLSAACVSARDRPGARVQSESLDRDEPTTALDVTSGANS